jgi:hypothetical protein
MCRIGGRNMSPRQEQMGMVWYAVWKKFLAGTINTTVRRQLIQWSLILRWFVLQRFTFATLVQSDQALPTCGASMSQLKRPFSTLCASTSFPVCTCFLFFYFSAVLLSWLWFFHPWRPSKRQQRENQNSWRYVLSWCLLNHGLGLPQQNKKWFDWYFFQFSV